MSKGFNTVVEKFKSDMISIINANLQQGVPISVVSLILESLSKDTKVELNRMLEVEKQQEEGGDEVW